MSSGEKMIRITQIKICEYNPDYEQGYYKSEGITDIKAAFLLDQKDYETGQATLEELGEVTTEVTWEIIDE